MAASLAAVIGYALSPLTPVGAARDAEPHPGFSLEPRPELGRDRGDLRRARCLPHFPRCWRVVNTTALPGTVGAARNVRATHLANRRPSVAHPASARRPWSARGLALQPGRGATATPVRSVLASLTLLVVATVTATFAFGVNLQRWTTTPRLYGWNWDAAAGSSFGTIPPEFEQAVEHFPHVARGERDERSAT